MTRARFGLAVLVLLLAGVGSAWSGMPTPAQAGGTSETTSSGAPALSYRTKPDNPDYRYIEGTMTVSGALLAYWETLFLDAEPVTLAEADKQETLYLRFYPADDSPAVQDLAEVVPDDSLNRIFLYRSLTEAPQFDDIEAGYDADDTAGIEQALEVFADVPAGFIEAREGYAIQAVTVTLTDMVSYTEGDHRFTYARAEAVAPREDVEIDLGTIEDFHIDTFLGVPWRQEFFVSDAVPLRASPRPDAGVVEELAAGTPGIVKLQTLADGWVRVRLAQDDGSTLEGYLRSSQLWVIN